MLAGLGGVLPGAAWAQGGLALAQAKACMACHQVDSRRVGPPLREVAMRYASPVAAASSAAGDPAAGDPAAGVPGVGDPAVATLAYLADSIREGGRGRWGAIPMPAQPQVSAAEARELAQWILSLQPGS